MTLLNRYLLSHFLRILLLTLASFIGIYLLIDFFEKIGDFLDYQAGPSHYLSFVLNNIPVIITQVLPLAILMTVVLTLGSLSRTNELTAMRSCGLGLWRIIRILMLLAFFISTLQLIGNETLVPVSARNLNHLLNIELEGKAGQRLTQGKIWYRDKNRIVHIVLADPKQNSLQGITLFELSETSRLNRRLSAATATYRNNAWHAQALQLQVFDPHSGELTQSTRIAEQKLDLGRTPDDFQSTLSSNSEVSIQTLNRMINKLEAQGFDATRQRVDMHARIAAPFTCLVMAFLAVPFALQRGRGSSIAVGIGLSLSIGVIYFIAQSLVIAFGYSGALPPIIAAWSINLIFLLIGIWMLLNLRE